MKPRERMDAALSGATPDRAPFSFWHHFGLQNEPPEFHAKATLRFQQIYRLDLVKVMSDFPYPKGAGANWWELKPLADPFPAQIEALKLIHEGIEDTSTSSRRFLTLTTSRKAVVEGRSEAHDGRAAASAARRAGGDCEVRGSACQARS